MKQNNKLIAVLTNNDDDIYCFRKELIERFIDEGFRVLISCPYGEKFELMQGVEYIYDDPDIDRRGTNIIKDAKLLWHYIRLFSKHRPSVVLTYTAKPNIYGSFAARVFSIPVISNVTGFGSVIRKKSFTQKLVMTLFKMAYSLSSCVMFQNATNMEFAEKTGLVKVEHQLIPGSGVNTKRYPAAPYPDGGNGIDGAKIVFNYIGRILHDKGVDDYISAAEIIKEKYPATEFNLLGFIEPTESHYEQDLKELENRGIVRYHGSQKDIKPFVTASHATVHPSTYGEGMSNVLLESASSARPVITTDNPGCMETLIDGVTGFMYHGGNVSELCEKIESFLALPNAEREAMGLRGREYIEENFSRNIVVQAYMDKINELTK